MSSVSKGQSRFSSMSSIAACNSPFQSISVLQNLHRGMDLFSILMVVCPLFRNIHHSQIQYFPPHFSSKASNSASAISSIGSVYTHFKSATHTIRISSTPRFFRPFRILSQDIAPIPFSLPCQSPK